MPSDGILPNVLAHLLKGLSVKNAHFGEAFLPNWCSEPKFSSCPKREPSLDELQGALDGQVAFDCQQQMKMVGHDHEFMQAKFPLLAIVVQNAEK